MYINGIISVFGKYDKGSDEPTFPEKFAYAQVVKNFKKGEVGKVEKKTIIGDQNLVDEYLNNSEVSRSINTSFVERVNLTLR